MPNITTDDAVTYKNFRCNLAHYESKNLFEISLSLLIAFLNPKILGFLFPTIILLHCKL